jgi:hypothetical protein
MADEAVTMEDPQKVYKRLEALESGGKEANRLIKIQDEATKDLGNLCEDHLCEDQRKTFRADINKIDTRVTLIEKKLPKK